MLWSALLGAAMAAAPTERELATFPMQVRLTAPASGVARVDVPLAMRTADDQAGYGLLLLDERGERVSFAVGAPDTSPQRVAARRGDEGSAGDLLWWPEPEGDGRTFIVQVQSRPIDALEIRLPREPSAADVTVWLDDDTEHYWAQRAFRFDSDDVDVIELPARPLRLRVRVEHLDPAPLDVPTFTGLRHDGLRPRWTTAELALAPPTLQENGHTRYDFLTLVPFPFTQLQVVADDDLFERTASIVQRPFDDGLPETLGQDVEPVGDNVIRRIRLGGATVDDTWIRVDYPPTEPVLVVSGEPLRLSTVRVRAESQTILIKDPGEGPLTLYAGGRAELAGPDLQFAAAELGRGAVHDATIGEAERNPRYQLAPDSVGLGELPTVDVSRMRWSRAISAEGLSRLPLDSHVLSEARSDLGDLRVIGPDGATIPYALRPAMQRGVARDLPFERDENGSTTRLNLRLPEPGLPLESVTLRTSATDFQRDVVLLQPRGNTLQPLRRVSWEGRPGGSDLAVAVRRRVGDRILVHIENGDNAAVAVSGVDVTWSTWELVANLPPGAKLVYGDPQTEPAQYDIQRNRTPLDGLPTATLGEVQRRQGTSASAFERAAVFGGIGVLSLGLVGLLLLLLFRAGPKTPEATKDTDDVDRA